MVVAVAVEHVGVDRRHGRRRGLRRKLLLREREARIAHEALVVEQDRGDVLVPGDEPDHRLAVDAGLAEDRIVLAHARERGVGVAAELVPVEVVLPRRRRHGLSLDSPDASAQADAGVRRHRVPRLGATAGRAHGGGRPARRARRRFPPLAGAGRRGPDGHRRARLGAGRLAACRGRPAARARGRCAERGPARRRRRSRRRAGPGGLQRPLLGPCARLPLPDPASPSPLAARRPALALVAASARPRRARTRRRR